MGYKSIPLTESDIPIASRFVEAAYDAEKKANPILPPTMFGNNEEIIKYIKNCIPNGAVALEDKGRIVGFMAIFSIFSFKGQKAVLINEISHGSHGKKKYLIYQKLYESLGNTLKQLNSKIHIMAHFHIDTPLLNVLFQLGFGAFLAERVRSLNTIPNAPKVKLDQYNDFENIIDLESEHTSYYQQSPIFLKKDCSKSNVIAKLGKRQAHDDVLFTYSENGRPMAYSIVGKCTGDQNGFTLKDTNTAQIMSFYSTPSVRGKGIGKALLNRSIEWARDQGYSRLFVEHETANIYGGNFWQKYFNLYLYFSMRYIDY